jgi:hypothetical protein
VGDGSQAPVTVATDPARYFMKSHERIVAQLGSTCLYQQQRGFFRLIETNELVRFGQREVNSKQIERLRKLRGLKPCVIPEEPTLLNVW